MFNSNKGRDARPAIPAAAPEGARGGVSAIGADMVVAGNVTATAELHIDGRVDGDVRCGTLAQGAESQIFGSVTAEVARLAGAIEGGVRVRHLVIERSARITGDVEYETISIENGGHIDGRLKHLDSVDIPLLGAPNEPAA